MVDIGRRKPRVALALQGGGAHGAYAWGVVERLLEEDIELVGISGQDDADDETAEGMQLMEDAIDILEQAKVMLSEAEAKVRGCRARRAMSMVALL